MDKVIHIGENIFCRIHYTGVALAITGEVNPRKDGSADSCGQIHQTIAARITEEPEFKYAPGWNREKVEEFLRVWMRWHLNTLTAGSPRQEAYLRSLANIGWGFASRKAALVEAGLEPDMHYLRDDETGEPVPYHFGSRWLTEEVPLEVVQYLESLPETNKEPA